MRSSSSSGALSAMGAPASPAAAAAPIAPAMPAAAPGASMGALVPPSSSAGAVAYDLFGLPFAVSPKLSAAERARVGSLAGAFMSQVLSYGRHWSVAQRALELDPHSPLLLVLCADYRLACEDIPATLECIAAAKRIARVLGGTSSTASDQPTTVDASPRVLSERERLYVSAFDAWLSGRLGDAQRAFTRITRLHPADLYAAKRAQLLAFLAGDAPAMLRVVARPRVAAANARAPYYHGMLAFALEQNGRLAEALAAGQRGTALSARDPWAHHGVAHALYFLCRVRECYSFLRQLSPRWDCCMSFMFAHNWFHAALCLVDADAFAQALAVLDDALWPWRAEAGAVTRAREWHAPRLLARLDALDASAGATWWHAGVPQALRALPTATAFATALALDACEPEPSAAAVEAVAAALAQADDAGADAAAEAAEAALAADSPRPLPRQDPSSSQDQLGALGLLWKLELRMLAHAAAIGPAAAEHVAGSTGLAGAFLPALTSRYRSVAPLLRVGASASHMDPFFDVLAAFALARVAAAAAAAEAGAGADAAFATLDGFVACGGMRAARRAGAGDGALRPRRRPAGGALALALA